MVKRSVRVVLIALIFIGSLLPFLLINLEVGSVIGSFDALSLKQSNSSAASASATTTYPLSRKCPPGVCLPRRYFSTTTQQPAAYYLEPDQFANVPSRPWDEASITPLDLRNSEINAVEQVRRTMQWRYNELIMSDLNGNDYSSLPPKYLPPQFPQWDRVIHLQIVNATILGLSPACCPTNIKHQFLSKNMSKANILSDEELNDCDCRSPRNYPKNMDGPMATIITAFYEMSSKHPVQMYEKTATQLLSTADPMIIFCEPNTRWVDFFIEHRKHAPTIVVPLSVNDLRLKQHFRQETVWKNQYDIDPEGPTHHKGVNTMLYIIWDEKLLLLHSAAMLNPFNTSQFLWVDTGYFRSPAPHAYRQSVVRINITQEGVKDDSVLLYQMINYNYNQETVISGNQVLVGGNSFIGLYAGISNLYSAFYDTFWTMLVTGKFVGSDQKVMYRTCHTYPNACHIHKAQKQRGWLKMLGELLPGIEGGEKIGEPLRLHDFTNPDEIIPVPPNGIVNYATSETIWSGIAREPTTETAVPN